MKSVVFDVGGVLLDWNPGRIMAAYYPDPEECAAMRALVFHHPDWLELDRGTLTESALLRRIGERAGREVPELDNLFQVVRESLQPKTATLALLRRLDAEGVPLYCLSNMPQGIYAWLQQRFDFWSHFDGLVISGAVGLVKPEAAIFEHLLREHGLEATETAFVDDLPANVRAASTLGLTGVLFQDASQVETALREFLAQ